MYVVKYKFILHRDVNPVFTHYVVSKLENLVELIECINTLNA